MNEINAPVANVPSEIYPVFIWALVVAADSVSMDPSPHWCRKKADKLR